MDVGGPRQRRARSPSEVARADLLLREHRLQYFQTAGPRGSRVRHRVVTRRIRRDSRQQSCLRERQPRRGRVEVGLRGTLDAIRAVPEVNGVEIGGEDAQLRPALLELPGEGSFLELAADRPCGRDTRVLDELLRDRRSTLYDLLAGDVRPDGASDAAQVDAVVLVEAFVLDRDDRLLHDRRDVVRADEDATLGAPQGGEDGVPVVRIDVPVHLALNVARVTRWDLTRDCGDEPERERRHAEQKKKQKEG